MKYFTKKWVERGCSAEDFLSKREQIYQAIPRALAENFDFHDGSILSFEMLDDDYVMTIDRCVPSFVKDARYVRLTFKNGKITERDDNIDIKSKIIYVDGLECYDASCIWMYDELYKTESGYEAHMMLLANYEWGYITITCSDILIENISRQQLKNISFDRAVCEKIKTSCGLRQIINGNLHDAGVADAQTVGSDLILTLDLNEGQIKDDKFYRKVMVITFENISNCSMKDSTTRFVSLFVNRHREEIVDGKLSFSFEMWNDKDNTFMQLALCCDDVSVKYSLVND